jgi:hypothetical protein
LTLTGVLLEGATKELKRLLDKHYSPHTLPIKWHLIFTHATNIRLLFLRLSFSDLDEIYKFSETLKEKVSSFSKDAS